MRVCRGCRVEAARKEKGGRGARAADEQPPREARPEHRALVQPWQPQQPSRSRQLRPTPAQASLPPLDLTGWQRPPSNEHGSLLHSASHSPSLSQPAMQPSWQSSLFPGCAQSFPSHLRARSGVWRGRQSASARLVASWPASHPATQPPSLSGRQTGAKRPTGTPRQSTPRRTRHRRSIPWDSPRSSATRSCRARAGRGSRRRRRSTRSCCTGGRTRRRAAPPRRSRARTRARRARRSAPSHCRRRAGTRRPRSWYGERRGARSGRCAGEAKAWKVKRPGAHYASRNGRAVCAPTRIRRCAARTARPRRTARPACGAAAPPCPSGPSSTSRSRRPAPPP